MPDHTVERLLPDEAATARLGQDLAAALRPGDVLALSGDLGAGKTALARALIRANAGDPDLEVPSPTFTLVQTYDVRVPISHFDLYRLGSSSELDELGFEEALREGAVVVEWPERAGGRLPADTVRVELLHEGEGRRAVVSGSGAAFDRYRRALLIREFLADAGMGEADRIPLSGDASARAYEIILARGEPAEDPDEFAAPGSRSSGEGRQAIRGDRPYRARPWWPLSRSRARCGERGVAAPKVLAADFDRGLLLLEHLGTGSFLAAEGRPVGERYAAAAELLAALHDTSWPRRLEAAPGISHHMPPFDRDALMIEVELLLDWYVPWKTGKPADAALRARFAEAWNTVFDRLDRAEQGLVMRDFHSPNIVWRADRSGFDRMGILDFQDALIGPVAYDVASLAMDARVTVSADIEQSAVAAYVGGAPEVGDNFDESAFREAYAITAAQRNTKILGIFVRLKERDGKPGYLKHLPRIRAYVRRALEHPALAPIAALYEQHGLLAEDA